MMNRKVGSVIFVLFLALTAFPLRGDSVEGVAGDPVQNQLDEIKSRLANLEKGQQEISAKDDKILEELDRLRIWVRRR